ncbi:MAG: orotate phosphoribosyltransferase [Saprospiraceae bacterium]|nr:orotate phosphoribosyltransferase [Saprospiraceae bacterium]
MNRNFNLAEKLLQIKAIKLSPQNPFTWASGIKSPIYCDNRITLSYPDIRKGIKESLSEIQSEFEEYDMISGVATAGIAHGVLLADKLNKPFSYVRASAKGHGRQNQIEGEIKPESRILVIEDLISTGGSSLEAVEVLRNNGHTVVGVLAIFDYGFKKAAQNFMNSSCNYRSLSDYPTLLQEATSTNYITAEEAEILGDWNKDPDGWYQKNFES